ncbi:MAG: DNA mismatch repair endonuclease MutL [Halobellus sp.]
MGDGGGGNDAVESGDADDSPSPTIHELDDRTVRQIAAGEVVERPASVVKELLENSLDADASRISVAVDAGGTEGVRVRDDGVGMDREGVRRAVEEHTTSKIDDIDDLEAGVGTLGFRGEALHTIGAVSRLTIRTKPRGGGAGTELRVEGGEVTTVEPAGCPEGTVVAVEDLFYNTPARRKFLKTTATEFDHVNTVVTHYALANPDVAISLEHDDREVFATEGRGSLRSAVLSVYGREVAESMIEVDHDPDAGPIDRVEGLVSHPETTRSTREYLSTFVNDRYVTAGTLREAVLDAYGGQLATDRYPFAVLFVDVSPDSVDVNVHPRKMEVRFDEEAGVREAVAEAVRSALLEEGLIRSTAPRGRSAPDETEIAPESPAEEVRGGAGRGPQPRDGDSSPFDGTDGQSGTEASGSGLDDFGAEESDSSAGDGPDPSDAAGDEGGTVAEADASADDDGDGARALDPSDEDAWRVTGSGPADRNLGGGSTSTPDTGRRGTSDLAPGLDSDSDSDSESRSGFDLDTDAVESDSRSGRPSTSDRPTGIVGPTTQRDLRGEQATLEPEFDSLPSMRILGQLHDTYVVAETDDGMVLVDQHAADERVNYERLQRELDGEVATQALADPVTLELTAREAALFAEYREALAELGFRAERTGDRTVEVAAVPAVFAEALDPERLRDALSAFVSEGDSGGARTVDAVVDDLLADLACYPSVTGNTSLTEGSVVGLLEALDDCENPYACPHGRPVVVAIDAEEIGDRFERDYPGHGGRRAE